MNKKITSLSGLGLCLVLIAVAVFLMFLVEGDDAVKMKIACAGFVLFMLHCCYRIYRFSTLGRKISETDETERQLQQVYSLADFFRTFFAPKEMRFRTSFSLFIILVLGLFSRSFLWLWGFAGLFVASKAFLLIQYYRYWKAWHRLVEAEMNAEVTDNDEINEEAVSEFTEILKSCKRNAISIDFGSTEDMAYIGCSKYGGCPDVSEDFQWPVDDHNRPLSLLLQINCSDITPFDTDNLLPTSGLLYFFYELGEQNWEGANNSVRVLYQDIENVKLRRADYPATLAEKFQLNERRLSFSIKESYPRLEDIVCQSHAACQRMIEEMGSFYEAWERLHSESEVGTMLGYADLIQAAVVDDLEENILLLQLFSIESADDTCEFQFGDLGTIYFYISRQDIKEKRFENIKFELQCY